jgi:YfiH family protein
LPVLSMSIAPFARALLSSDLPLGWMRPVLGDGVSALMSARAGGVGVPPYDECNLGDHVGDEPATVWRNRALFAAHMDAQPVWLTQVHGARVVRLTQADTLAGLPQTQADGALTTEPGVACTVMVADCLPLLLAGPEGRAVAALHAGWRGLAGAGSMAGQGVVQVGLSALCEAASCDPADVRVWLGPCIGPRHFEVGADVLQAFGLDPAADSASCPPGLAALFERTPAHPLQDQAEAQSSKWLADLAGLAGRTLTQLGVRHISGGTWCTVAESARFFSFRRERITGRQAAAITIRAR